MNIITQNLEQLQKTLQNAVFFEFNEYIEVQKQLNPRKKVYKNGTYKVIFNSELGPLTLRMPRVRTGIKSFKSKLLQEGGYSSKVVSSSIYLYGQGLSTRRIKSFLHDIFNINISKSTISDFCKELNTNVVEYFEKYRNEDFVAIFIDAKYFKVNTVSKNKGALISAVGLTKQGYTKSIHMKIVKREGKNEYISFLKELKEKFSFKNQIFIVDGIKSSPSAIQKVFKGARIQRCIVHVIRNLKSVLSGIASKKEIKEIEIELYNIFFDTKHEKIKLKISMLFSKYQQYFKKLKTLLSDQNIYQFLSIPGELSNKVKTNNTIEQFHSNLEAVTKQHRIYSDESSLYRALIQEIERYNNYSDESIENIDLTLSYGDDTFNFKDCIEGIYQTENIVIKIYSSCSLVFEQKIDHLQKESIIKTLNKT